MFVLLWALTDSAVERLMFSCVHHVLRQNFGFHNGVIGELLIQNSISTLSGKSEHLHPLKSATCARFNP